MRKIALVLAPALLATFMVASVMAENEGKAGMKVMGKSLGAAEKADDVAGLKKELQTLRDAAAAAQKQVPDHLRNQAADSADRKLFAEGISKLLGQIDASLALANAGKLAEAKASLAELKATRGDYHKKLKP